VIKVVDFLFAWLMAIIAMLSMFPPQDGTIEQQQSK